MYAGKLRHRLVVERLSESQDANTGELGETWRAAGTYWALVEPLSGEELFESKAIQPQITHRVTLRYGNDVTTRDRLVWASRVFGILGVINTEERNRELVLACKELVS